MKLDLGTAVIAPAGPFTAGSHATITLTYTAGHPIDDTGCVKLAFRFASDFGTPQFTDPAAPNYCLVRTTAGCAIEPRWDPKGHPRPWGKCLFLKVMSGYVDRGERIEIVFGERGGGSPGWQLPTFVEPTFEFKTLVDPIATYCFKELPVSPTLAIVAGPAVRALCIAPSSVAAEQPFVYHLKLEDAWGNPVASPAALPHPGLKAGIHRLAASDAATGLAAVSNPVEAHAQPPATGRWWGDLHGQSEETIGTNTIDDYFRFARDCGLVDVAAHQGNDFQVTDAFWQQVNDTTRAWNQAGRFVTFPGYEWSGNTPLGGDRNIYFEHEGGEIVHSCLDLLPGEASAHPVAASADDLFAQLRPQTAPRAFGYAHIGGRYADLAMHDPEIELAVEVHSAWGTFEWLVADALRRGCRVGLVANSDGHKGRPGASYPGASRFGSLGGLTCFLAERLDRTAILDALRARHVYATTGHRPLLAVALATSAGQTAIMGDIVRLAPGETVRLRIDAVGTGPIERLEVRRGLETVAIIPGAIPGPDARRVKVLWSGAEVRGRARKVTWDGRLTLTGNAIETLHPINFWNPQQQPERTADGGVRWRSITTGGLSGMVLTLREPTAGQLAIETAQTSLTTAIDALPLRRDCGGLGKRLEVCRLADDLPGSMTIDLPNIPLNPGDNPLYVCVVQADGHLAWSSPIYVALECGAAIGAGAT